jgi:hypothetical protein
VATATFIPPEAINMPGYELHASPTLYPGQTVRAGFMADPANSGPVMCRLYIQTYGAEDKLLPVYGPQTSLNPGGTGQVEWCLEDTGGAPIANVGLEITSVNGRADGSIYLDFLTWSGEPRVVFKRPESGGVMWRRAWVNALDPANAYGWEAFRVVQNQGTGLLMQGSREWENYSISSAITPHLVERAGIGARVQGMRRYYALFLCRDGIARLVKALDSDKILAEIEYVWLPEVEYTLQLDVRGTHLSGRVNGRRLLDVEDTDEPLTGGSIALICTEGRMATESVSVSPL